MTMSQTIAQMRYSINLWGSPKDFSKHDELIWIEGESKRFALSGRAVVDLKPNKEHYRVTHLAWDALHYSSKYVSAKVYGTCTRQEFSSKIIDVSREYEQKLNNLKNINEDDIENLLKELVLLLNTSCVFREGINNIAEIKYWPQTYFTTFQYAIMDVLLRIYDDRLASLKVPSLPTNSNSRLICYRYLAEQKYSLGVEYLMRDISIEKLGDKDFFKILKIAMKHQTTLELIARLLKQLDEEQLISFVKAKDFQGNMNFHRMVEKLDRSNLLTYLLEIIPEIVDVRNNKNILPFEIAMVHQKDPELLAKLMEKARSVIVESKEWAAILFKAAQYQTEENLATLLPWFPPESFSAQDKCLKNDTALHLASRRPEISGAVLAMMARLCGKEVLLIKNYDEETFFHLLATRADCAREMKSLLEMVSFEILFQLNRKKENVFEIAMKHQTDLLLLETLLKMFYAKLLPDFGLLHLAARYQSVSNLEILMGYFPQVSFFEKLSDNTPFLTAVYHHPQKLGAAIVLLRNSKDYDVLLEGPKRKNCHSIKCCALKSLFDLAMAALEKGEENRGEILNFLKNLNNYTHTGHKGKYQTLLHILIDEKKSEQIKLLLESGADPYLCNTESGTASRYVDALSPYKWIMEIPARQKLYLPSIKHIKEGYDQLSIDAEDASNQTLTQLFNAIYHGNVSALHKALDKGIEIDETEGGALHLAAKRGHADIVRILLEKGFDPNVKDENGWTPLKVAVSRGDIQVFEILSKHEKINEVDLEESRDILNDRSYRLDKVFRQFLCWARGYRNERKIEREDHLFLICNLEPLTDRSAKILRDANYYANDLRKELETDKEAKDNEIVKMLISHLPRPEVSPKQFRYYY